MSEAKLQTKNYKLENVTILFPNLVKPKLNKIRTPNRLEYGCCVGIAEDHPQLEDLLDTLKNMISAFDRKHQKSLNICLKKTPVDDPDFSTAIAKFAYYLNPSSQEDSAPILIMPKKEDAVIPSVFSHGMTANILLAFYPYCMEVNKGITAYIKAVQCITPGTQSIDIDDWFNDADDDEDDDDEDVLAAF